MSTMSASSGTIPARKSSRGWLSGDRWILWIHVVALALHAPLMAIYFRELWSLPHYSWFPFTLLFIGYYVWVRSEEFDRITFSLRGFWANLFLILAIPFVLFANLRFDPEFAGIGCFLIAASLLARTRDRGTGETMLPAVFALALMVRLPFGIDTRIITSLQRLTSQVASRVLDLFGVDHLLSGNVIRMQNRPFLVEEACGGIQSFFLLLFCALAWVAYARRGLIRSVLLICAAVLWAIVCNSARVLTICMAHAWWNVDLASGIPHVLIGYLFMGIAIGLLISSDYLLEFTFGRGDSMDASISRSRLSLLLFGGRTKKVSNEGKGVVPTMIWKPIILLICGAFALVAMVPLVMAGPSVFVRQLTKKYIVHEISREVLDESFQLQMAEGKISPTWTREKFEVEERDLNSEWGSRSSKWFVSTDSYGERISSQISCDYPFSGWHELTVCYRGSGWIMSERELVVDESAPEWPVVVAKFQMPTGIMSVLMFSMFDEDGKPVETMVGDIRKMGYMERAFNTIRKRLRKDYGPFPQTYQVQMFVASARKIEDSDIEILLDNYVRIREKIRTGALSASAQAR